jgi:hypothetical protein
MKMEAVKFSETSNKFYHTVRRHFQTDAVSFTIPLQNSARVLSAVPVVIRILHFI